MGYDDKQRRREKWHKKKGLNQNKKSRKYPQNGEYSDNHYSKDAHDTYDMMDKDY